MPRKISRSEAPCLFFLAILLPPVALILADAPPDEVCINLCFTILFWFVGSIHAILVIMRLMNNPPPNYVEAPMSQQPYGVQPIPVMIVPGPNSPPAPGAPGAPGASQPQPQPQPQSQNQNQGGGNVPPGASAPSPPVYPGYAYYEQSPGPINSWTPREHRQLPDLSYGGRMQWEDRPGATSSAATSPEKQNSPLPESAPLL